MECRLYSLLPVGIATSGYTLVIGEVLYVHAHEGLIGEHAHVDTQKLRPIGRLAGSNYAYVHETFSLARKRYYPATGEYAPLPE